MLLAGVAAYGFVVAYGFAIKERPSSGDSPWIPRHEILALLGFTFAPTLFFVVNAVSHSLVFFPRYGIISVMGVAGCSSFLLFHATKGRQSAATAALSVLLLWFAAVRFREVRASFIGPQVQFQHDNPALLEAVADGLPVVVPDPLTALQADFYLHADGVRRLYYLASPSGTGGDNVDDHLMMNAARYLPLRMHVDSWVHFASYNNRFLLATGERQKQWIYDQVHRAGWSLTLRTRRDQEMLFEVAPPR